MTERIPYDLSKGIPVCGTPPGPGEHVWRGDREFVVSTDGKSLIAVDRTPPAGGWKPRRARLWPLPARWWPGNWNWGWPS